MYVSARIVPTSGDPRKVAARAISFLEPVKRKTGLAFSLHQSILGAPLGTLVYSTLVGSLAERQAAEDVLSNDEEFLDLFVDAQQYVSGPIVDEVMEIVHAAGGEYRRAEVGSIVSVIRAQVSNARYGAAAKWGTEMADLVAEITQRPIGFCRGVAGEFGSVAWLSTEPNMATLDAANEALAKDPRYMAKLDEMVDLFLPGSGRSVISKRIA